MSILWKENHKFDRKFFFSLFRYFLQSSNLSIHFAITNGDEIMYDLLEKSGALTSSIVTDGDNTLLHWFCYKKENDKNLTLLQKLLDTGCNINAQNHEQLTPLMIAAKFNMIETCRLLLNNQADIDKYDFKGNQAIDLTTPGSECSKLLLQEKHTRISPLNEKILWKKRIDSTRRRAISEVNGEVLSLFEEIDLTNSYLRPPNCPSQKRHSDQFDHKHKHVWEKLIQSSPRLNVFKTLHNKREHSVENRNRS
jgi:hypothetical protein